MKAIKFFLFALLAISFASIANAQTGPKSDSKPADLSGDWEISVAAPTGPMPVTGSIKQDGQTVSGKLTTPYGPGNITSGSVTGSQFKIMVAVRGEGNRFDATMTGTLDGDKMKGSVDTPQGAFDFTGTRKAATASTAGTGSTSSKGSPVAGGSWVLTVNSPNGDLQVNLTVKQDGENLSGTISSQFGQSDFSSGKFSGNKFSFPVAINVGGDSVQLVFTGVIDGDTMKGNIESPQGSFDFSGARQKGSDK